ncbi:pyridoxamine 5'-phosphate oxidase family protein [Streptomyces sp. NPDC002018]|uniref:pyridoxamine 5'-phosphate oxidase family protein n=1 Tax=Streptomyces sp. NPDC002018 TaxID=3364629 RepID=UPI0036A4976C
MSDPTTRPWPGVPEPSAPRHMKPLDRGEALRLLRSVSLGRIVFTRQALPAVRPVNHLLDGEDIIIRLGDGAALASLTDPADGRPGAVVAYEADAIDPERHLGWSVVVTGYARVVEDPADLRRYESLLRPWVSRAMTDALRIRPELVTGFRLVSAPVDAVPLGTAPAGTAPAGSATTGTASTGASPTGAA